MKADTGCVETAIREGECNEEIICVKSDVTGWGSNVKVEYVVVDAYGYGDGWGGGCSF